MAILAVSSSSAIQTIAVAADGVIVAAVSRAFARRQPRRLLVDINTALAQAGLDWAAIHLLAADVGPGSFTGIRAGLATVRALAFAHELPCVAMTSTALVASAPTASSPVGGGDSWIALPSRAASCFLARRTAGGVVQSAVEMAYDGFGERVPKGATVVASLAVQAAIARHAPDLYAFIAADAPTATALARAAASPNATRIAWQQLVPHYVAASDAERNTGVFVHATAIPALARAGVMRDQSTILPAAAT